MLLKCLYCQRGDQCIKSGRNRSGSQRYRCLRCNRYFTAEPKSRERRLHLRKQALDLYMMEDGNSLSQRNLARKLGVHHQTVIKLISTQVELLSEQLEEQVTRLYREGKAILIVGGSSVSGDSVLKCEGIHYEIRKASGNFLYWSCRDFLRELDLTLRHGAWGRMKVITYSSRLEIEDEDNSS